MSALTEEKNVMCYERGAYPRGHSVPCKHCGWLSAEHALGENEVKDPQIKKKGFKVSFRKCGGYEPKNIATWEMAENAYLREQERSTFKNATRFMHGTFILR